MLFIIIIIIYYFTTHTSPNAKKVKYWHGIRILLAVSFFWGGSPWYDLTFANSQRVVQNRTRWRELVTDSSVVPQRSVGTGYGKSEVNKIWPSRLTGCNNQSSICLVYSTNNGKLILQKHSRPHSVSDWCILVWKSNTQRKIPSCNYWDDAGFQELFLPLAMSIHSTFKFV